MSVWFITGAARGFGRGLVDAALAAGDQVIATARNPQRLMDDHAGADDGILAVALDVTDEAQARRAVSAGMERFGRIDVVVNNAGYGLFGSVEETPDASVRELFNTNVFGLLNVTRAVLPTLRAQRSGHIITMSSSAGFAVSAGRGLYGASKFAVEAISEALHAELQPLGIAVTAVEPGSFRAEFLSGDSRRETPVKITDYEPSVGPLLQAIAGSNGKQPGNPAQAVEAIRALITMSVPPLRLQLGSDAVKLVENKLDRVRAELEANRETSLSTDF